MEITASELARLIAEGEGRQLEFKRGLPRALRIARTLCALANTDGGMLLIGVEDRGGICGLSRPEEVIGELRAVARDQLQPALELELLVVQIEGRQVVCCSVPLSGLRPHRTSGDSECVVRVGSRNRVARGAMLRALATPARRDALDTLERSIVEQIDREGRATVTGFASTHDVGVQRVRRAFRRLEREGLLVGHGPDFQRLYATP